MNDEPAITVRLDEATIVRLATLIRDDRAYRVARDDLQLERHEAIVSRVLTEGAA